MTGLYLGTSEAGRYHLPASALLTHAVIVGQTGSGKTGMGIALLEEARAAGIPVIAIDPKGDLGNLALTFPQLDAESFAPWVEAGTDPQHVADQWAAGIAASGLGPADLARAAANPVTVYTPGSLTAGGRTLNLTGRLTPPTGGDIPTAATTQALTLLALTGRPTQPTDPDAVMVAAIIAHHWHRGHTLDTADIIRATLNPPFNHLGALPLDHYHPPHQRHTLAMRLNTLLARPTAQAWATGTPPTVPALTANGGTAIINTAHLPPAEAQAIATHILTQITAWQRTQPGTTQPRLLVYVDEATGMIPPVANPPTKPPLMTILKQGRAHGVCLTLATQNPADLDYKATANAATWLIGRLATNQDRDRITKALNAPQLADTIAALARRQFVAHTPHHTTTITTRHTLAYLAGPLAAPQLAQLDPITHALTTLGNLLTPH